MLDDFDYQLGTRFFFGRGAEMHVGEQLKACGARTVLLHYGSGRSLQAMGVLDRLRSNLAEYGLRTVELAGVKPNPRLSLVQEGITLCRAETVDYILAIGGGSVIDSAKAIGIGVPYEGDVWDFYIGKAKAQRTLPVAVVLTYPAAGSESSKGSVINKEDGALKRSYNDPLIRPQIAFLNPELTYSLPPHLTACGVVDMYAHVIERYFSDGQDFGVIDHLCEGVMRSLLKNGPRVLANPQDYQARAEIMWTGTLAHNDMVGVGRVQDWGSHTMAHEISGLYDTAHGDTLAIVIPAWMRYVMHHDLPRFVRYATAVFGIEDDTKNPEEVALRGIEATKQFFASLGMPTSFAQAGLPVDRLEEMARKADGARGDAIGTFVPLHWPDALQIYQMALT